MENIPYRVFALGEYTEDEEPLDYSIYTLVGLQEEELKPGIKQTLENLNTTEAAEVLTEFSRAVHGYYQFQDILDLTLETGVPVFNRHYCYYESLVYLRESILSWLDGNVLAATTLLRPFLELTMLHLYWYLRSKKEGYQSYYEWLNGKSQGPGFKKQVNYIFSKLVVKDCFSSSELGTIKDNILKLYKWGCIYNHTPKVEESMFHVAGGTVADKSNLTVSLGYYPLMALPLLREVVCTFMLVYPMSFFPVDRYAKWGFGGLHGIFLDHTNVVILKAALTSPRFKTIKSKVAGSSEIESNLNWFMEQAKLSDKQLEESWVEFQDMYKFQDMDSLEASDEDLLHLWAGRISLVKSARRNFGWIANYLENPPNLEDINLPV